MPQRSKYQPKPCATCRKMFRPRTPTNRFCSRQCSAESRPKNFYRQNGKKGGSISGAQKRQALKEALGTRVDHLTPLAAFLAGARWQTIRLNSGIGRKQFRRGYEAGWDACVKQFGLDAAPRLRKEALAQVVPVPAPRTAREVQEQFVKALKEAV
jgi:hypothetical protein